MLNISCEKERWGGRRARQKRRGRVVGRRGAWWGRMEGGREECGGEDRRGGERRVEKGGGEEWEG